jgi:hypothetical protein
MSSSESVVYIDITELGQRGSELVDLVLLDLDLRVIQGLKNIPSCLQRPCKILLLQHRISSFQGG